MKQGTITDNEAQPFYWVYWVLAFRCLSKGLMQKIGLAKNKDIWNHPIITDRNGLESYEVADLMAEFANSVISIES